MNEPVPLQGLRLLTNDVQSAFQADHEYLHEHFDEWLELYRDQWVVVKDCKLQLHTPDLNDVVAALKIHGNTAVVDLMRPRGFQRVVAVQD